MRFSVNSSLFLSFFVFILLQRPTLAVKKSYIVYLGGHSHGPEPSADDFDRVTDSHYELLGSFLGSNLKARDALFHSYTKHINAFSAMLEDEEAAEIAKHPDVISIFLNKLKKLDTTNSWTFLGVENNGIVPSNSIWKKARFGEDTIIGTIDSGVWPESKSFSDEGMGPVPSRWRGICQPEEGVRCNRKLIGARYFNKGYEKIVGRVNFTYSVGQSFCLKNELTLKPNFGGNLFPTYSARDHEGHGTHTLSTAGGNFVAGVNYLGFGNRTIKGGSSKARVASYKPCWPQVGNYDSCYDSDILDAFDTAIYDGVDIISASIGMGHLDYFKDVVAIGAFHAIQNGVVVVGAAGNDGEEDLRVENVAPWIISVAASTQDREFSNVVTLGNKKQIKGVGIAKQGMPENKLYPLITGAQAVAVNATIQNATFCTFGSIDANKVRGKILVCIYADEEVVVPGIVGIILVGVYSGIRGVFYSNWIPDVPTSQINNINGEAFFAYINSTKSPMAHISGASMELGVKPSPYVAFFSSSGPNNLTQEILKPDITAPGVNIIAAFTQSTGVAGFEPLHKPGRPYSLMTDTSMSTPHVSGIVGLLKTLHPDWSPAAMRSAIMTTAYTRDNTLKPMLLRSDSEATPFNYGAGHIRPNHAMNPGLVYDLSTRDYLNFLCTIGYNKTQIEKFFKGCYKCLENTTLTDFNYPSITIPNFSESAIITRIVKNVGTPRSTYKVHVKAPPGISISVRPRILKFERIGEEKKFKLTLEAKKNWSKKFKFTLKVMKHGLDKGYVFGKLVWSDGKHHVRSPIVVGQTP